MIDTITGFASAKWQQAGTTLLVREDKKPLTKNHVEALWMFNDHILDSFGDDVAMAHAMMNRHRFDRFWIMYRDNQIDVIRQCQYSFGDDRNAEILAWENANNPLDV